MLEKKAVKIIAVVLLVWITIFIVDWFTVACFDHSPIFCIENKDDSHYTGLGYSYDAYPHPINGDYEYCLYIFRFETISTFTN